LPCPGDFDRSRIFSSLVNALSIKEIQIAIGVGATRHACPAMLNPPCVKTGHGAEIQLKVTMAKKKFLVITVNHFLYLDGNHETGQFLTYISEIFSI
jgi:hypothetical protein